MPMPASRRIVLSEQQANAMQLRVLRIAVRALRHAGAARTLAAVADVNIPDVRADDLLAALADLAHREGAYAVATAELELPHELRTSLYLYGFASARMVAATTGAGLALPTAVAEALAVVERWSRELLPGLEPPAEGVMRAKA